jgi:phospholipid/cholesterol/gamma-HCH transport system substrate-binding protein
VAGGFVVNSRSPDGNYDAHFGLILDEASKVCKRGYDPSEQRPPQDGSNKPMDEDARCAESIAESNARGAQHAPRVAPGPQETVVATYDQQTGRVSFTDRAPSTPVTYTGGAHAEFGEESWKWLLLQPLMPSR